MKAVIYTRVSTTFQVDSGAGLQAQEDSCQGWASREELPVGGVFSDAGVSGSTGLDKRPGLLEAISTLSKGDLLLVAKRDRLGRDPIHVAMIESAVSRKGARVVSSQGEGTESDDPSSILMRRMIDAFAEYERLVIGARTKAALQAKKARKERVGGIPYGWQLSEEEGKLIPHQGEQEVIQGALELKTGGLSLRKIGVELEARGLLPRSGKRWHAKTVKALLNAEVA